jgi:hypothetical protein
VCSRKLVASSTSTGASPGLKKEYDIVVLGTILHGSQKIQ